MKSMLLRAGLSLLVIGGCVSNIRAEVTTDAEGRKVLVSRDASGRVLTRAILSEDGSRHLAATEYWPQSKVAKRTVEEDQDRAGRATKRTVRHFDQQGRLRESRAVSIDVAGNERGTRTRYAYDAQGRAHKMTSRVGR